MVKFDVDVLRTDMEGVKLMFGDNFKEVCQIVNG